MSYSIYLQIKVSETELFTVKEYDTLSLQHKPILDLLFGSGIEFFHNKQAGNCYAFIRNAKIFLQSNSSEIKDMYNEFAPEKVELMPEDLYLQLRNFLHEFEQDCIKYSLTTIKIVK